jgi:hypothetical protein
MNGGLADPALSVLERLHDLGNRGLQGVMEERCG